MKKMIKKLIVTVLSAVLMLTAFTSNPLAADASGDGSFDVSAFELLVGLGVVRPPESGFDPARPLTRAEFAQTVSTILNSGPGGASEPSEDDAVGFTDIKGHWAEAYINHCAARGAVSGSGAGFHPDDAVTGAQAAKMLLAAVGYDPEKEAFVNDPVWESNVRAAARKAGIFSGFDAEPLGEVNSYDAALMCINALFADKVTYDAQGALETSDMTQAEEAFGLRAVAGVVVACEYAALEGFEIQEPGFCLLLGEKGETSVIKVEAGLDMLGRTVSFFAATSSGGSGSLALAHYSGTLARFPSNTVYRPAVSEVGFKKTDDGFTLDIGVGEFSFSAYPASGSGENVLFYDNFKPIFAPASGSGLDEINKLLASGGVLSAVTAVGNTGRDEINVIFKISKSFARIEEVRNGRITVGGGVYGFDDCVGISREEFNSLQKGDAVLFAVIYGSGKLMTERTLLSSAPDA